MNVWIASDIHGSALYCRQLLDLMERQGGDRLVLLGDLLYHGPRNDLPAGYDPKQVFAMLNARKDRVLCVHGNCDAEVDQMVLDFPIGADFRVEDLCGRRLFLTHGHHCNVDQRPSPAQLDGAGYVVYGHFHVPMKRQEDGRVVPEPRLRLHSQGGQLARLHPDDGGRHSMAGPGRPCEGRAALRRDWHDRDPEAAV